MSKFDDGNVGTASMQSWRVPNDKSEAEKWPTSRWFRKYHANCQSDQWRSRDSGGDGEPIRQNKHLEQASSCGVWKAIRKEKSSTNNEFNAVMELNIKQRLIKNSNKVIRTSCIPPSYDTVHRIHEYKSPYERDQRNWRLRIEKVVEQNSCLKPKFFS